MMEHLALPAAYWTITSLVLLKHSFSLDEIEEMVAWVLSCQNTDGGFGGSPNHDSNITCTLYAVIIITIFKRTERIDSVKIINYTKSLYSEDLKAFQGDCYGEIDNRFNYAGLYLLKLMGEEFKNKTEDFIEKCFNYDGGFGGKPNSESHAAYMFCAVGALSIIKKTQCVNINKINEFICLRQTTQGGFNGRPEKLPDVCYSWWVLASLHMIGDINMIDLGKLTEFILNCQNSEGGFADRPGNDADVFHTFFAIAALSIINCSSYDVLEIDPIYAIPKISISFIK